MHGYMGKMLHVNLDIGVIAQIQLDDATAQSFIGGYGIGAKFLYEHMKPNVDPLGGENIIGFISGPLNNTWSLYSGRYTVVCKSPVTGGWNDANSGGTFGSRMKKAGVDAIFVSGKSSAPVYLYVENGKAEIKDASGLWGLTTSETEDKLRGIHGKRAGIALIGPGGENCSYIAAVMNDKHRAAARGGPGAVMGSKNLKAVVVKGRKRTKSAHPLRVLGNNVLAILSLLKAQTQAKKDFKQANKAAKKAAKAKAEAEAKGDKEAAKAAEEAINTAKIVARSAEGVAFFPTYGTGGTYTNSVMMNDAGIKNFTEAPGESYSEEDARALSSQSLHKYKAKKFCCPQCHIACSIFLDVHSKKRGKRRTTRPEYETMGGFGSMLLNKNIDSILRLNEMCNEYGLDTISAGGLLAWAMECYDKGILTKEDLDGIELKWGDGEAAVALFQLVCDNKGIGQILKLGSRAAADKLGKGHECLVVCGGIEQSQHDARYIVGLGGTYMADPTPGRHVKASVGITSQDEGFDPKTSLHGLAAQYILAIIDGELMNTSGACSFGFSDGNKNGAMVRNISAVTGNNPSLYEMQMAGLRIFTMRQMFNAREGIGRAELSERVYKGNPPFKGIHAGIELDFNIMVDELYDALGWSRDGVPSDSALKNIGLGYLIPKDRLASTDETSKMKINLYIALEGIDKNNKVTLEVPANSNIMQALQLYVKEYNAPLNLNYMPRTISLRNSKPARFTETVADGDHVTIVKQVLGG